jgi:acetyltransferase-like isoleucine patch superfamily enzyme
VRDSDSAPELTLNEVALTAGFTVARDAAFRTLGFISAPLPGMLAFAENERFLDLALRLKTVRAVITRPELGERVPSGLGLALSDQPLLAFCTLHNHLARATDFYGVSWPSMSDGSSVHPRAFVAETGVNLGHGCSIAANATVLGASRLGKNVIVHEGVVVGSLGLQVEHSNDGIFDLDHAGRVEIGDGVRIMANSVIARGLFRQATVIGPYVRIGNLSFISHNVEIGAGTIVGHGVTINGGASIGRGDTIGPGVTVANGVKIGDGAEIVLGAVVVRKVPAGGRVSGNFAAEHRLVLRGRRSDARAAAGPQPGDTGAG